MLYRQSSACVLLLLLVLVVVAGVQAMDNNRSCGRDGRGDASNNAWRVFGAKRGEGKKMALHTACADGYLEMVKLLLHRKADVNAAMGDGSTPLRAAVMGGHTYLVPYLIYSGAIASGVDGKMNSEIIKKMHGIVDASLMVKNTLLDQDGASARFLPLLAAHTPLSEALVCVVGDYATHETPYQEVNAMVHELMTENKTKHEHEGVGRLACTPLGKKVLSARLMTGYVSRACTELRDLCKKE